MALLSFGTRMVIARATGYRTSRRRLQRVSPAHSEVIDGLVALTSGLGVVDAVSAKRLFYRDFPGSNVDHWIEQVKKVNALDFDFLIGGHGPVGNKADVASGLVYLEELRAEVLTGLNAGKTVDVLKATVTMPKYRDWGSYEQWRALNVQGMARHLKESGAVK